MDYSQLPKSVFWIGERVAVPDLERVRRNVREQRDDVSWGPNHLFRYPRQGGTGAIWSGVAALLKPERLTLKARVASVDVGARQVRLEDGRALAYDHLITTLPLDVLVGHSRGLEPQLIDAARALRHSSVHILGVGLCDDQPEGIATKCWVYCPDAHSPYYRVTVLSNYSPFNVPPGPGYWSLMAEACESPWRPLDATRLRQWTLEALRKDGFIGPRSRIVNLWHRREEHGYPTPFLGRDAVLASLLPALERWRVYPRGRFGAWKYEVSNQDHSFMQGVEVVNRLLGLGDEPTLTQPSLVNGGAFARQRVAHGRAGGLRHGPDGEERTS